jgi:hypothetical protein
VPSSVFNATFDDLASDRIEVDFNLLAVFVVAVDFVAVTASHLEFLDLIALGF